MMSIDGKLLSDKLTYDRVSIRILLCLMLMVLICHCSPQRRIIENPDIDDWNVEQKHYKNLFPPQYGYMEESDYDAIDFRQPHEKGTRKYALLSDPRGDIDRTKGYDPAEYTINPDLSLIHQPAHDIQVTWIRHASCSMPGTTCSTKKWGCGS